MDKSKIIRYVVIVASVLMMAATAVPCQQIITDSPKKHEVEYVAVMPSFIGVIILVLALGCIALAFSPKYKNCIWPSLGCALLVGVKLIMLMSEVGVVHHEGNYIDEALLNIGAQNLDVTYDVTTKNFVGFYIIAGCAVVLLLACLITFFVGVFNKPNDDYDEE